LCPWQQAFDSAANAFKMQVGLGTSMTAEDVANNLLRVKVSLSLTQPGLSVAETFEQEMAT